MSIVTYFSEFIHLIIHLSLKHYGKVQQFHVVFVYYNYYWTWAQNTKSIKADKESGAVETKINAINVTSSYWKRESVHHIVTLLSIS